MVVAGGAPMKDLARPKGGVAILQKELGQGGKVATIISPVVANV